MWTLRHHLKPNSWHLFLNAVVKEDSEHSAVSWLKIHISSLLFTLFTLPSSRRQKQWKQGDLGDCKGKMRTQIISPDRELDAQMPQGLVSSFPKPDQKTTVFWAREQPYFPYLSEKATASSGQPLTSVYEQWYCFQTPTPPYLPRKLTHLALCLKKKKKKLSFLYT